MIAINNRITACPEEKNSRKVMQGDQYAIPFRITDREGTLLTDNDLTAVEIVIGTLRKITPDITYNPDTEMWEFPLTQSDSLALEAAPLRAQVRGVFPNGNVVGGTAGYIHIIRSLSEEVL